MQALMSSRVAMTRDGEGLAEASEALGAAAGSLAPDGIAAAEARNLLTVADLIVSAARYREESRGTHFRADFPARDDARWRVRTVWRRGTPEPREVSVRDHTSTPPGEGTA
jgi:L-aspartate oxidase